jgi:hypothetical protein
MTSRFMLKLHGFWWIKHWKLSSPFHISACCSFPTHTSTTVICYMFKKWYQMNSVLCTSYCWKPWIMGDVTMQLGPCAEFCMLVASYISGMKLHDWYEIERSLPKFTMLIWFSGTRMLGRVRLRLSVQVCDQCAHCLSAASSIIVVTAQVFTGILLVFFGFGASPLPISIVNRKAMSLFGPVVGIASYRGGRPTGW